MMWFYIHRCLSHWVSGNPIVSPVTCDDTSRSECWSMDQRFPRLFWRTGPRGTMAPCWALEIWGDFSREIMGIFQQHTLWYGHTNSYWKMAIYSEVFHRTCWCSRYIIIHIYIYIDIYSNTLVYQRVPMMDESTTFWGDPITGFRVSYGQILAA